MKTVSFTVPNISCDHCVHTIKMEVGEIDGVHSVYAENESKKVVVEFGEPATEQTIIALLNEINYPPEL